MTSQTRLVIGGTGKTSRRILSRLQARGAATRGAAARSASPPGFNWGDRSTRVPTADGLVGLFTTVLDGRNARTTREVSRALGRTLRGFATFVAGLAHEDGAL